MMKKRPGWNLYSNQVLVIFHRYSRRRGRSGSLVVHAEWRSVVVQSNGEEIKGWNGVKKKKRTDDVADSGTRRNVNLFEDREHHQQQQEQKRYEGGKISTRVSPPQASSADAQERKTEREGWLLANQGLYGVGTPPRFASETRRDLHSPTIARIPEAHQSILRVQGHRPRRPIIPGLIDKKRCKNFLHVYLTFFLQTENGIEEKNCMRERVRFCSTGLIYFAHVSLKVGKPHSQFITRTRKGIKEN